MSTEEYRGMYEEARAEHDGKALEELKRLHEEMKEKYAAKVEDELVPRIVAVRELIEAREVSMR